MRSTTICERFRRAQTIPHRGLSASAVVLLDDTAIFVTHGHRLFNLVQAPVYASGMHTLDDSPRSLRHVAREVRVDHVSALQSFPQQICV